MRKQVQKERCTKIMLTKCKAVCCLYNKVQLAAAKMLDVVNGNPLAVHRMGISQANGNHCSVMRYCPVCYQEDLQLYGEPYWHRSHQLPDMQICTKHRCWLVDTDVTYNSARQQELFPATFTMQLKKLPAEPVPDCLLALDLLLQDTLDSNFDYGHFTTGKVWKTGEERRYEINISSASLNQECAFLAGVLVHEMVHEYCAEHGIKDTSNNGVYHNKNFKHIAETHGLEVEHHPKYGWTITSPGLELLDFIEEQGWQDFQMVESLNLLDVLGTLPKGGNSGAGAETRTKKPSSTRKYICPKCSNSCRATKVINLICGDCMEKMVVAE